MQLLKNFPRPLLLICLTEIGERFSFYMLRNILVLYLVKVFLFSNNRAYATFAAFTSLFYFTPLIGGYLTDKWLKIKTAITLGGLVLSLGYFILAQSEQNIFLGLGCIVIGSGFFMPNIANTVGKLYESHDTGRESGFTLFYIAIQIGALIPALIAAFIITQFGWQAAFMLSAIVILCATVCIILSMLSLLEVEHSNYISYLLSA